MAQRSYRRAGALAKAGRLFITDSSNRSLGFFPETGTYMRLDRVRAFLIDADWAIDAMAARRGAGAEPAILPEAA